MSSPKPHRGRAAPDSASADFNPAAHPIIARHFFGVEPFRPIGEVAAEVVADLRRRRHVQQFHRLGVERGITTIIDQKLDTYTELDPEALEATGGDGFWSAPLREV